MSSGRFAMLAGITALAVGVASASQARAPTWIRQSNNGHPAAAIGVSGGISVTVFCYAKPSPRYVLVVKGPARGLQAGRSVATRVEGRKKIKLRFDKVELAAGNAILTTQGGSRGSTGDQSGALEAIEAIRTAKKPITVTSGPFSVTVPATGVEAAMAPLVSRCGDIRKMIKRAEGREGELPS
jgi:hypothetical protein